jgi:CheY-like chemotaxis protein
MDGRDLGENPEISSPPPTVRVLAAVSDLLFVSKISAAAQQVGLPLKFFKDAQGLLSAAPDASSIVIVDLNNAALDPIALIRGLKQDTAARNAQLVAFLSHVQHDRKREAEQAGCDLVLPRSVFFQNLNELLRQRSCHL